MPVTSDFDPASPTGMVLSYLRSKGLTPDANNVRSALQQQAAGANLMPGLVTEEPPPADQRNPSSTTKNVASKVESSGERALPTPPMPPTGAAPTGKGEDTTSAQPTGAGNWSTGPLGDLIIAGAPALGMGAGAAYYLNRGGAMPGASVPPPPDVGAPVAGDQYRVTPGAAEEDPFNLMKAIQGREGLPPGVSPVDAVNAANPAGMQVQPPPEPAAPLALPPPASQARPPGEPPIPITPKPLGQPRVTVEELPNFRARPPMRLRVPG